MDFKVTRLKQVDRLPLLCSDPKMTIANLQFVICPFHRFQRQEIKL